MRRFAVSSGVNPNMGDNSTHNSSISDSGLSITFKSAKNTDISVVSAKLSAEKFAGTPCFRSSFAIIPALYFGERRSIVKSENFAGRRFFSSARIIGSPFTADLIYSAICSASAVSLSSAEPLALIISSSAGGSAVSGYFAAGISLSSSL